MTQSVVRSAQVLGISIPTELFTRSPASTTRSRPGSAPQRAASSPRGMTTKAGESSTLRTHRAVVGPSTAPYTPDEVINAQPGDSFKIGGGIHGLVVGEQVDFEWEPVIDQDGYKFRAIKVRPQREIPPWYVERIGR